MEECIRSIQFIQNSRQGKMNVKQHNFLELLSNLKINQQLQRKFKMFIGIGFAAFLIVGALLVWAGITAVQQGLRLGKNPQVQEQVLNLKGEIKNIPALAKVGCWNTVQSHLSVKVWIEKPIADNLNTLKLACVTTGSSK